MTLDALSIANAGHLRELAMQTMFGAFDRLCHGTLIVDHEAKVVWINDRYAAWLDVDATAAIGRPIEEIIPNSQMRTVVETGEATLLDLFEAAGRTIVVIRIPLRDAQERIIGAVAFALLNDLEGLKPLVNRFAALRSELAVTQKKLAEARRAKYTFSSFIGTSQAAMEVKRLARRAANLSAPVLLCGATGTGKELLAHAIHAAGPRADRPFVILNMAAIPENLLEAECFGVVPGAFTGADRKPRAGKFELANGGTLFLDEIGDMPLPLQSKLLRVLQEQEFEALGSNRVVQVDVRILAATSRDLEAMVAEGRFRRDLFYRLNVLGIPLPPLRERLDDLELLCEHLLDKIILKQGTRNREISARALELLRRHDWPGTVRELRNALERAVLNSDDTVLQPGDFQDTVKPPAEPPGRAGSGFAGGTYAEIMAQAERSALLMALETAQGNVGDAARRLGIGKSTFYRRMTALQGESRAEGRSH